jgi:hypothetical protein
MRRRLACVVLLLLCVARARAEEPRALVERAVKAAGGDVDPSRYPATLATGPIKVPRVLAPAAGELYYQSVTTVRFDLHIFPGPDQDSVRWVVDGDTVWLLEEHGLQETPARNRPHWQLMARFFSPVLLPSLLADRGVTFSPLPVAIIQGRTAHGVKATLDERVSFHLYFDQQSGLLLCKTAVFADRSAEEKTVFLSDYREPGVAEDEATLTKAGVGADRAALLAFLEKHTPDPVKEARATALVRRLGDETFEVREKAVEDLVALGGVAMPHLERALKDEDAERVRLARACLERLIPRHDTRVLTAAVRQVARGRFEGGTAALLKLLPGLDEATTRELRTALVLLAEREDGPDPVLVAALKDANPAIRAAAEAVLGNDGGAYLNQPGRRMLVRGLKQPMALKLIYRSEVLLEMTVAEVKYFNRLDSRVFAKP